MGFFINVRLKSFVFFQKRKQKEDELKMMLNTLWIPWPYSERAALLIYTRIIISHIFFSIITDNTCLDNTLWLNVLWNPDETSILNIRCSYCGNVQSMLFIVNYPDANFFPRNFIISGLNCTYKFSVVYGDLKKEQIRKKIKILPSLRNTARAN